MTQVVDGALEALHAPLHVRIIDRHLAIQVVRDFAKMGHVLIHDGEVVCDFLILLIDASLEQCEALVELLALCPKVVLGCQPLVVVEDVILPCVISVPRHGGKTRAWLWMLVLETTSQPNLGMIELDQLTNSKANSICIGLHTQEHTQKLANMVDRQGWWKAKRRNPRQSMLLRVGKVQKSSVQTMITTNTEKRWNTHKRWTGLVQPKNERNENDTQLARVVLVVTLTQGEAIARLHKR